MKISWLLKGIISLLNPQKWGVFQEAYRNTRFDSAFTPSWSQAGEDLALDVFLNNSNTTTFYLDIGAHDPNRFSVTRKLYNQGWVGIDVDGNPSYEAKFRHFRPRNKFLNVCVGNRDSYEFTIYTEGAISTTNSDWAEKFRSEGAVIKEKRIVRGMKLREILDLSNVPSRVGFINIDVEGADEDALRSIQFETLQIDRFPQWILLETAPPVKNSLDFPAVKYAVEHGYVPWLVLPMATLLKAPENM
jgi:FkbM family methyltransferase